MKTLYYRVRAAIYSADDPNNPAATHPSVNAAKRWSREFQQKNGGIGAGAVRSFNTTGAMRLHAKTVTP